MSLAASTGAVTSVAIEASFAITDPGRACALISDADLAVLNREALRVLSPCLETVGAGVKLLETCHQPGRPKALVVTAVSRGSLLLCADSEGRWSGAVHPATETVVIESTGAGDTFAGTFVGMILSSVRLVECLHIATRAATRTLQRVGARGLDESSDHQ
jgi:sugar/nucleoside kinase (ribokinase family)